MVKKLLLSITIVYTLVLVFATFGNIKGVPSLGSSYDDKVYHFLAYFGLAVLWVTYFKFNRKKYTLFLVFVGMLLFGVLLELIQHQLNPNRTYDSLDLLANCIGVIIGTLIAARLHIIKLK